MLYHKHINVIRLWVDLTDAIGAKDMERATVAKTAVEDAQREERKKREELGVDYVPRFFEKVDGHWIPKLKCAMSFCLYAIRC